MGRQTQYQRLTSPEKTAKLNRANTRLMKEYIDYLRSVGRSPSTIKAYESDLLIFFTFVYDYCNNKQFFDIKKRDLISFQNWLMYDNGNSPARVRRIKATVSSLSNYVETILDEEFPDFKNIVHKIESPVLQPKREKSVFSDDELQKMLQSLVDSKEYEIACALALAMYSGRRKAELVLFKVSYFTDENIVFGTMYKTPEPIRTKGRGLNGKPLYCYVDAHGFKPYFDLWMKERERTGINSIWLFPHATNPDKPVGLSTMNGWAEKLTLRGQKPFYWHSMRHFFVSQLAQKNIPETVITNIVGWDSVEMFKIYNDTPIDDELAKYFSPVVATERKDKPNE